MGAAGTCARQMCCISLVHPLQAGLQPCGGSLPYLGVWGAPGFPWQLSMAECTGNTVSGKSISSWEPEGSLWINWQYQPLCC